MQKNWKILFPAFLVAVISGVVSGQQPTTTPEMIARRNAVEAELQSIAVVERKVMVPMRDGKRMQADVCIGNGAGCGASRQQGKHHQTGCCFFHHAIQCSLQCHDRTAVGTINR